MEENTDMRKVGLEVQPLYEGLFMRASRREPRGAEHKLEVIRVRDLTYTGCESLGTTQDDYATEG